MAKQTKAPPARAVERITLTAKDGGAAKKPARAAADVKPETREAGDVGDA